MNWLNWLLPPNLRLTALILKQTFPFLLPFFSYSWLHLQTDIFCDWLTAQNTNKQNRQSFSLLGGYIRHTKKKRTPNSILKQQNAQCKPKRLTDRKRNFCVSNFFFSKSYFIFETIISLLSQLQQCPPQTDTQLQWGFFYCVDFGYDLLRLILLSLVSPYDGQFV